MRSLSRILTCALFLGIVLVFAGPAMADDVNPPTCGNQLDLSALAADGSADATPMGIPGPCCHSTSDCPQVSGYTVTCRFPSCFGDPSRDTCMYNYTGRTDSTEQPQPESTEQVEEAPPAS